jgi:hypothetical protein
MLFGDLTVVCVCTLPLLFLNLLADTGWFDMQLGDESARHIDIMDMRTVPAADPAVDAIVGSERVASVCEPLKLLYNLLS